MAPQSGFIVTLAIICLLYPSVVSAIPSALLNKICKSDEVKTRKDFCLKTLADPTVAPSKDIFKVNAAVMKIASAEAKKTLDFINGELAKKPADPKVFQVLKACEEYFSYAIQSFHNIPISAKEDPDSANYDIAVVGSSSNSCAVALQDSKLQIPQISAGNDVLSDFSSLGGSITGKMPQPEM